MTLRLRCRLRPPVGVVGVMVGWCPLFFRASLYAGMALLNSSESQDSEEILLVMDLEMCLMTVGGWFDWTLI